MEPVHLLFSKLQARLLPSSLSTIDNHQGEVAKGSGDVCIGKTDFELISLRDDSDLRKLFFSRLALELQGKAIGPGLGDYSETIGSKIGDQNAENGDIHDLVTCRHLLLQILQRRGALDEEEFGMVYDDAVLMLLKFCFPGCGASAMTDAILELGSANLKTRFDLVIKLCLQEKPSELALQGVANLALSGLSEGIVNDPNLGELFDLLVYVNEIADIQERNSAVSQPDSRLFEDWLCIFCRLVCEDVDKLRNQANTCAPETFMRRVISIFERKTAEIPMDAMRPSLMFALQTLTSGCLFSKGYIASLLFRLGYSTSETFESEFWKLEKRDQETFVQAAVSFFFSSKEKNHTFAGQLASIIQYCSTKRLPRLHFQLPLSVDPDESYQAYESFIDKVYALCSALHPDMIEEYSDWLVETMAGSLVRYSTRNQRVFEKLVGIASLSEHLGLKVAQRCKTATISESGILAFLVTGVHYPSAPPDVRQAFISALFWHSRSSSEGQRAICVAFQNFSCSELGCNGICPAGDLHADDKFKKCLLVFFWRECFGNIDMSFDDGISEWLGQVFATGIELKASNLLHLFGSIICLLDNFGGKPFVVYSKAANRIVSYVCDNLLGNIEEQANLQTKPWPFLRKPALASTATVISTSTLKLFPQLAEFAADVPDRDDKSVTQIDSEVVIAGNDILAPLLALGSRCAIWMYSRGDIDESLAAFNSLGILASKLQARLGGPLALAPIFDVDRLILTQIRVILKHLKICRRYATQYFVILVLLRQATTSNASSEIVPLDIRIQSVDALLYIQKEYCFKRSSLSCQEISAIFDALAGEFCHEANCVNTSERLIKQVFEYCEDFHDYWTSVQKILENQLLGTTHMSTEAEVLLVSCCNCLLALVRHFGPVGGDSTIKTLRSIDEYSFREFISAYASLSRRLIESSAKHSLSESALDLLFEISVSPARQFGLIDLVIDNCTGFVSWCWRCHCHCYRAANLVLCMYSALLEDFKSGKNNSKPAHFLETIAFDLDYLLRNEYWVDASNAERGTFLGVANSLNEVALLRYQNRLDIGLSLQTSFRQLSSSLERVFSKESSLKVSGSLFRSIRATIDGLERLGFKMEAKDMYDCFRRPSSVKRKAKDKPHLTRPIHGPALGSTVTLARRSENAYIDTALAETARDGDSDGYEDLEDFIICEGHNDFIK